MAATRIAFSDLSSVVDQLAVTSSRLRRVELVADLLRRTAAGERAALVFLLQGQLRPPFEGIEIGLGDRLIARAIADAYGAPPAHVAKRMAMHGDLGLVAESLAPKRRRSRLSIGRAHAALLEIAGETGGGSVQRRIELLVALLGSVSAPEAKLLVRVAQGKLRLGLGDQTILEAAALAALGGRREKPLLEHAYNVRSDLGSVVALAFTGGKRALARIEPVIGVPVRPALAQRLPSAGEIITRLGAVRAEPKFDGFRLQLHRDGERVTIFSRRLENVTAMFPELAEAARRRLKAKRAIIEGEAIACDPRSGAFLPFQVTMTRKRKERIAEMAAEFPLRLFAFDLLYTGRRSLLAAPQRERSQRLAALIPPQRGGTIAVADALITNDERELERYFDEMLARGLEGIVAKRLDAPYNPGARGYDWVKLKRAYQSKLRDTVDVVIVGYLRGRGRRAALGIGSMLAAVYDPARDRFRTVAKIGSGLSDSAWKALRTQLARDAVPQRPSRVDAVIVPDVWVEPKYVVEVLTDEITRSPRHTCGKSGAGPGYALRFPRVLGAPRADRSPADATTEREILDMYRQQRPPSRVRSRRPSRTSARRRAARAH